MRQGWGGAALCALGTFLAGWPMATLFEPDPWIRVAALALVVIAVVGVLARSRRLPRPAVVLVQVGVLLELGVLTYAGSTTFYGLPTLRTAALVVDRFEDAVATVQHYSVPAPVTPGVAIALVSIVALAGLAADALSETWGAPAAAGVPMLILYLSAAANGSTPLHPAFFAMTAATWAVLLARRSRLSLRRWSTTVAAPRGRAVLNENQDDVLAQVSGAARATGVSVVIGALVVAALLPHLPTRYLIDGLGRGGVGGGDQGVGLSSTLDVSKSLGSGDDRVVLRVRTATTTLAPMRVTVATAYSRGVWTADSPDATRGEEQPAPLETEVPGIGTLTSHTVRVVGNDVPVPYVAVPVGTRSVASDENWRWRPGTGEIRSDESLRAYSATYDDITLSEADRAVLSAPERGENQAPVDGVDAATLADLRSILARLVPEDASAYDVGVAVQNYLRSAGGFTYSLSLDAGRPDESPEQTFLRTKRGYCVQFATTMLLMARSRGIPARMAIGFLPGQRSGEEFVIRSSDAHAWPELYIGGLGWTRFEPTPATRTGAPPALTLPRTTPTSTSTAVSTGRPSLTERERPTPTGPKDTTTSSGPTLTQRVVSFVRGPAGVGLGITGLLALLSLAVPLTAAFLLQRRRRAARTAAERVEVEWQQLVTRLADLGVAPEPAATLREARAQYRRRARLEGPADEALGRVVEAVETVRYSPVGSSRGGVALAEDVHTVVASTARTRRRRDRLKAWLLPAQGTSWWRQLAVAVTRTPAEVISRSGSAVRRRVSRRSSEERS